MSSCSDEETPTSSKLMPGPEVIRVWPEPGGQVTAIDGYIGIAFSKPIDVASINERSIAIRPYVEVTYSMGADSYVRISPVGELGEGTNYTVTISTEVRDTEGHRLHEPYAWSFGVRKMIALYVAPDGQGNGTRDNPLGSIQQAVDNAEADTTIDAIYVATGEYHESLSITHPVDIYGGRDVNDSWRLSRTDSSIVHGTSIENQAVALLVKDVDAMINIEDLKFVSRDAGPEPSSGSYGVICQKASNVRLSGCSIHCGDGSPGANGTDGTPGEDSSSTSPARGGSGGWGGYETGGYWWCDTIWGTCSWVCGTIHPPAAGRQGWCGDGSQTGGLGGLIGGGAGEDGADGIDGVDGAGGKGLLKFVDIGSFSVLQTDDGEDGTDGGYGCGGGGGGGSYAIPCSFSDPSSPGTMGDDGGAGGAPGLHGAAGTGGGCSIGILLYHSSIVVDDCFMQTGAGGYGGSGGTGGGGGPGQPSEHDWDHAPGAAGGDGGDGGRGGHGGGGPGGASVAVVKYMSSSLYSNVTFFTAAAGKGGTSAGHAGSDGLRIALWDLLE